MPLLLKRLRFFLLFLIGVQYRALNVLPAFHRNGMSHVFMLRLKKLRVKNVFGWKMRFGKLDTALIAKAGPNDIAVAALGARLLDTPGRHGHKITFVAFDDFNIPDYKTIVKGDCGKGTEFFIRPLLRKNPDLGDLHGLINRNAREWRFSRAVWHEIGEMP